MPAAGMMRGQEPAAEAKEALRRQFRTARRKLPAEEKAVSDEALENTLLHSDLYENCSLLLVYCSLPREIATDAVLRAAWSAGKTVAAPVSDPDTHTMEYYVIRSPEDLCSGAYGIREPDPCRCAPVVPDRDSVCLVPGFAFDREGYRLGYGGGFYDRFLADFPGKAVGLCRRAWLQDKLPTDRCDRPADAVILEDDILFPFGETSL